MASGRGRLDRTREGLAVPKRGGGVGKSSRIRGAALALLAGVALSGCQSGPAQGVARGQELFDACAACHGLAGEGRREAAAPAIAGKPQWYLEEELREFREGIRGAHVDDAEGMRMRPMAQSLESEDDVKAVAAYVASLPPVSAAPVLGGDAEAGRAVFAGCAACHGPAGAGNPQLKVAPLAGIEDWYTAAQLRKFKTGIRGFSPRDRQGLMMRPAMALLRDEKDIRDVSALIATFTP